MREILQQLIYRQYAAISDEKADSDQRNAERHNLTSLVLADAALAKANAAYPERPAQIVVIGPTQVGKSSVVNMLIGQTLAVASPIAGHTVHCQGFYLTDNDEAVNDTAWLEKIFDGRSPRTRELLDRDLLSEYSMTAVSPVTGQLTDMVVWDTPDFDSVDSLNYSVPVLRAIAMADLVVLVVSKEKYADKSVWNLLRLLYDLNVPLTPVMNKTPVDIREPLSGSFHAKYARITNQAKSNQTRSNQAPSNKKYDTPNLRFVDDFRDDIEQAITSKDVEQLRLEVATAASQYQASRSREALNQSIRHFAKRHWHDWTASVTAEHQLRSRWSSDVDLVCDEAIALYGREYLQHDRYKETFQLALAELLALLEVPGIAEPITKLRSIVTWPMRKLKEAAISQHSAPAHAQDDRSEERRVLEELGGHALTQLARNCVERQSDDNYWAMLADDIMTQQSVLIDGYHRGLDSYQIMLQGEVETAAQSLYKKLQEQPATLNKLRAARVTADAAAIVLAVKSGGLGAVDLVLAPAMLSVTTMLTEGALGKYMGTVQDELRRYQQREVETLINKKLRARIKSVATDTDRNNEHYVSENRLKEVLESLEI